MKLFAALLCLVALALPAPACDVAAAVAVPGYAAAPLYAPAAAFQVQAFAAPAVGYYAAPLAVQSYGYSAFATPAVSYGLPAFSAYGTAAFAPSFGYGGAVLAPSFGFRGRSAVIVRPGFGFGLRGGFGRSRVIFR